MENIIRFKKYEMKSKTYIKYMLSITLVILFLSLNIINFLDTKKINNLPIVQDINSINVILGLISIPTCLLYYYMYKNNEFFILKLSYISIFIEYIFVNYIIKDIGLSEYLITFPFVIRIVLLTIAIFNESKYANKIVKNKKISIIIIIIINIIGTYLEIKLNLINILIKRNTIIWYILQGSLLLYYTLLLLKLTKRCIIKNEFIYTIFIGTISIFTIRRLFYFNISNNVFNNVLVYNSILTFIAYIILIAGLYIEMIRRIELNNILNNKVNNLMGFEKKYNEIKEIEKAKSQFFANLSHEIKTPIASSKLLIENNTNEVTRKIDTQMDRIENYVEQVLYYSRSNEVGKDYIIKKVELEPLVKKVIKRNQRDFISKRISLELKDLEQVVYSDSKWIEFILNQIIVNAIKYSKGNNDKIEIESQKQNNSVILSIKDYGVGINEKDVGRVFEKGFTGDNGRKFGKSTGIGLYLCKKLCEKLGLGLYIDSKENYGTKITIIFPTTENITE